MKIRPHHRRSTSSQTALRLLLGLLVCVSVLQIPVPMMHRHDELASSGGLSVHVDAMRHQFPVHADESHWHLMLPQDRDGDGEDSDDAVSLDGITPASFGDSCVDARAIGLCVDWWFPQVDSAVRSSLTSSTNRFRRIPLDFSPSVCICAVLCVMQV